MPGRHYELVCAACGRRQADDGLVLSCTEPHGPALLRVDYLRRFASAGPSVGLFRYCDHLPIVRTMPDVPGPLVLEAGPLGRRLGVPGLWLAFNGYCPRLGVDFPTCTFKDLEASTVVARIPEGLDEVLVVASAGNAAAAFAWACSRQRVPVLLVVPASALSRLQFLAPLHPCVRVIALEEPAGYREALILAEAVAGLPGYRAEGGWRNVARREGVATVMRAAVDQIGRLPDYYVQAVGSATGAIASHDAARELRPEATTELPKLLLGQNLPYAPVYARWLAGLNWESGLAEADAPLPLAQELTNRHPPYLATGGILDILAASDGHVVAVDNARVLAAARLFREMMGVDLETPAAVGMACLGVAAAAGSIDRGATVLLNVTGAGRLLRASERPLHPAIGVISHRWAGPPAHDRLLHLVQAS